MNLFDRESNSKRGNTAMGVGEGETGSYWAEPDAGLYTRSPRIMMWAEGRHLNDWVT